MKEILTSLTKVWFLNPIAILEILKESRTKGKGTEKLDTYKDYYKK